MKTSTAEYPCSIGVGTDRYPATVTSVGHTDKYILLTVQQDRYSHISGNEYENNALFSYTRNPEGTIRWFRVRLKDLVKKASGWHGSWFRIDETEPTYIASPFNANWDGIRFWKHVLWNKETSRWNIEEHSSYRLFLGARNYFIDPHH